MRKVEHRVNLDESYAKCLARYNYWVRSKSEDTENNWQGLSDLEVAHKTPEEYDAKTSIVFRREMIDGVLTTQPYVFIAGLSGVGKTTFIQENLVPADEQLFVGQEYLHAWLTATSTKKIFLFIDEANLTPTEWSIFEGLFLNRPAIFYNGHYYPLSENHKVIFAGNPLSYGGERELSKLFKNHGNTIVFRPLSMSFIEDVVLKPILPSNPLIIKQLLSIYTDLCQHSSDEILITPRELKALALLGKINELKSPNQMVDLFHLNVQLLLESKLSKEKKEHVFRQMELKKVKPIDFFASHHVEWGETHRHALHMIQQFLNLHLYRKNRPLLIDDEKYGGLSGIILEGKPGVGKTKMIEIMCASNQIDVVRMPASIGLSEKRAILYDAFNQGRVVWIDEFNSAPLLERELNAYLSGYDLNGKRPSKPGFLLIATQNLSHMMGRRELSPALLRRVIALQVSDYTTLELINVLTNMGVNQQDAECFVNTFTLKQRIHSFNFRDFLKFATYAFKDKGQGSKKRELSISAHSFFSSTDNHKKAKKEIIDEAMEFEMQFPPVDDLEFLAWTDPC